MVLGLRVKMETKICKKCGMEKSIIDFRLKKSKNGDYKIYYCCKDCEKEIRKKYNSRIEIKQKQHDYKQKYMKEHKEELKEKSKQYYLRPETKKKRKEYLLKNKEHIKIMAKKYREKNREELNKKEREKRQNDYIYRLKNVVRKLVDRSFNYVNKEKCNKTKEIVGLSIDELENYLLQTFKDNYGYEWDGKEKVHIDHIIPLAIAKTEQDVIRLCHYTNLQLLKAKDNLKKGTKLDWKLSNNESVVMPNA